jgi:RhoGAP domain
LPEDILPTSTQDELTSRYAGEQKAPEEVKEVLSQLPPWNYYLLFAITCHLSLLHAYQEKNKMTFNNLFVCFAPALRLNGDCFRWLVGDWRACWLGCATEKEALEEEYRILDLGAAEPNPPFAQDHRPSAGSREGSSAGSSIDATPRAEDFHASPHPPAAQQFAPPSKPAPSSTGHSSNNSASSKPQGRRPARPGSSPHSREGSLQTAERKAKESPPPPQPPRPEKRQLKENVQNPASNAAAAVHARGNSQLPELNLPQPISPTFPPNFMSKEGA